MTAPDSARFFDGKPEDAAPSSRREPDYLRAGRGVWSWLSTTDHKRIAIMFYVVVLTMLFLGGVFALALRVELLTPRRTVMDALTYNRLFTLHGVTMVWM